MGNLNLKNIATHSVYNLYIYNYLMISKHSEEVFVSRIGSVVSLVLSCGVSFIFVVNLSAALFLTVTDRAFSNVVTVVFLLVGAAALLVRDLAIVGLHRSLAHAAFNHIVIGLLRLALILLV